MNQVKATREQQREYILVTRKNARILLDGTIENNS